MPASYSFLALAAHLVVAAFPRDLLAFSLAELGRPGSPALLATQTT